MGRTRRLTTLGIPLSSGAAFLPSDVSGLEEWFDADGLPTLFQDSAKTTPVTSDGDPVGAWVDQAGSVDEALQTVTAAKPTYRASVALLGNQPALEFDGGDYLQGAFSATLAQPNTVFAVGRFTATTNRIMFDGDDAGNRHVFWANALSSDWEMLAATLLTGSAANTNAHIFTILYDGVSSAFYVDGTVDASGDAGLHSMDGITIGTQHGVAASFLGFISEWIIYDADLSTVDKNRVQNYLANKYGVTVVEFT